MKIIIAGLSVAVLSACTWVNENPEGVSVAITTQDKITSCERVGKITSRTRAKVGFVKRNSKKVLKEVRSLAKNEALKIGANTLAPEGDLENGEQTYIAYTCPR